MGTGARDKKAENMHVRKIVTKQCRAVIGILTAQAVPKENSMSRQIRVSPDGAPPIAIADSPSIACTSHIPISFACPDLVRVGSDVVGVKDIIICHISHPANPNIAMSQPCSED